jgi:hypothetical protein
MRKLSTLTLFFLIIQQFVQAQTFPVQQVTVYDTASSGYYFFCPYEFAGYPTFPPGSQRQMILDDKGRTIYYKDAVGFFAGDFKLQRNGLMSYSANHQFYLMDSTFTIIDSVANQNGVIDDLHELQILPNGNYLILGLENVQRDLSSYNMFLGNGTPGSSTATVRAGVVQELDANKNVVFEWHSIDAFDFDDVDEFHLTDVNTVDWTHMNAVELDSDGNILVSSRHFNEITKVSRVDSSVIWRLGGKGNQFTFIGDSIQFLSQHDCRRIANGHLTLFDNGRALTPIHPAAAKEYDLDETGMTATLVWSHTEGDTVYSRSQGNMQRLANGNTLISYGDLQPDNIVFNVVDSTNRKIFEISFPDTLITYRTFNYPSLPWSLNRPSISCALDSGMFYLQADSGHSVYRWSTGDSTQSIAITDTGTYSVFVPYGDGGFLCSNFYVVTDTANPCFMVSVNELIAEKSLLLFPNPNAGRLTIRMPEQSVNSGLVEIFDITGNCIMESSGHENLNEFSLDLSVLPSGTYFLRIGEYNSRFVKM